MSALPMTTTRTGGDGSGLLESDALRAGYGRFPSGVVAICAEIDGHYEVMIASSFVPVSLDPPLVAFCPKNSSSTWPKLARADRLGVSILGEDHDGLARSMSATTGDRFAGVDVVHRLGGALLIHGASAWFETSVEQSLPAGDHQMVLLRVHELTMHDSAPTVFHASRFRRLVDVDG